VVAAPGAGGTSALALPGALAAQEPAKPADDLQQLFARDLTDGADHGRDRRGRHRRRRPGRWRRRAEPRGRSARGIERAEDRPAGDRSRRARIGGSVRRERGADRRDELVKALGSVRWVGVSGVSVMADPFW